MTNVGLELSRRYHTKRYKVKLVYMVFMVAHTV